ncbi:hypothetical protein B0H14DRAFT_3638724 [Mycena olivaceomarginata]|nr:hypothetical protein B0H14DRAFT_3638724 [Mycena olivaceomarginata]
MVVVSGQSASSEQQHKKNRRKQSKKKSATSPTNIIIDSDGVEDASPTASTSAQPLPAPADDDDELMIDTEPSAIPLSSAPVFAPLAADAGKTILQSETRRIAIPPHRMTPLKKEWVNVFGPLTEILGLQVRMNRGYVDTYHIGALQKGNFIKAFCPGFRRQCRSLRDAIALLRLDDLYLDSFEIKDVKTLHGDHLSRAIGRIAGQDGKTKFTIENASRMRIVLADTKIHIMGSFQNIKVARDAIVSLILGSPPGKVYAGLRTVSSACDSRHCRFSFYSFPCILSTPN